MDLFERGSLGRVDTSHFGLWLNLDPMVELSASGSQDALGLTFNAFVAGVSDEHRQELLVAADPGLIASSFSLFTHEARHFHDLLATPYGSVLMRQYARAALFASACTSDLIVRSRAIYLPLASWVADHEILKLSYPSLPPPSRNLCELNSILRTMLAKLKVFDRGTTPTATGLSWLSATAILEGLATMFQESFLVTEFGIEAVRAFRGKFSSDTAALYFGAPALVRSVLDAPLPVESVALILLCSMYGDFQSKDQDQLRYPADLLLEMLAFLKTIPRAHLGQLDSLRAHIDDFFEGKFDDDLQGMTLQAAKTNQLAAASFDEIAAGVAAVSSVDGERANSIVAGFRNFAEVQAAFAANVVLEPSWFCSYEYLRVQRSLPKPVVFMECTTGIPVTREVDAEYYIQTETRIAVDQFPSEVVERFAHLAEDGVFRGGHILSPRFSNQEHDEPEGLRWRFHVPDVDIDLWQKNFDLVGVTLRVLLEGKPPSMCEPLFGTFVYAMATTGTQVFGPNGLYPVTSPIPTAADVDDVGVDPEIRTMLTDPNFAAALNHLRGMKQ